ncbi:ABC transporter ATP-binding protein [Actinomyces qiguomingii]|uniref:ABC transporter ATP-binding protein n=1 Tax=Actinomyces qiguomingii TaxID=2057800 RepID=UPI000CA059F4|nr:ABC transporter ATP-binding protein [Actinomyces qiguomingii]
MALPVAPGKVAMRKTFGIMASYRMRFVWVLILQITAVLATLVAPQLLGRLVTRVSAGTATVDYVDKIVLVIVLVTLVGALINRFAQMYARTLGESVFADLRERMMSRVVHLPLSAVESAGTGDLVGRTTNDVSRIEFLVRVGVPQIMVCTVTIVFTIAAAAVSDPLLAAGLLVVGPPVWAMMSWYLPISVPAYRAGSAAAARLNGVVSETVDHTFTVDALGIGRRREEVIAASVAEAWSLEKFTAWLRVRLYLVLDVAWRAPVVVILLWGGFLASRGWASLGAITTVTLYAMELRKPIGQLMFWIDQVQVSQASLTRILGVEEVPDDRTPTGAEPENTRMLLRNVRFAYREGLEVLHGIDLDLVPGERLAVVGPSGSGKSTLGRMLAGINPPTSGSVTVGGVPLTDLTEAELRRHVALVTQEQHVFAGTIADNVRLGRPDADDATIAHAIAAIGAHKWVDELPEGMHTPVGSGNLTLTPAQAQEVALARLVLLDPHTLILDEATSLLDPHAARTLERTLSTALAGRTVIEVAHRLYTAQDADRVAVMLDGRIVELGTHDELVALGGEYASLWEAWSQE